MDALGLLDRSLHIRLFRACHTVLKPDFWRYRYTNDAFWRLYRNESGGAVVTTTDETIHLEPGWLYVIPAHITIELACDRPVGNFYAHFGVIGLPDIALRKLFNVPFRQPCEPHSERAIQEATRGLVSEADGGQPITVAAQCWIKSILYEVMARHVDSIPPAQIAYCWHLAEAVKPVLPAISHIETHLSATLSNPLLAQRCAMSEGHFIRTFRDCMGQTPTQYIREQRVNLAIQRLLLTSDSIEQIAEEAGFGSRDYFSRIFARQTGRPPAAFRRSEYGDGS